MPIAHCILSPTCQPSAKNTEALLTLWADHAQQSSEHMTINLLQADAQVGQPYAIVANLYLPSLWSAKAVNDLQTGLAKALAEHYQLELNDVQVITQIIQSGFVVENGEISTW